MNQGVRCVAAALIGLAALPVVASTGPDTSLRFRVLLDGRPIGQHHFELREDGDTRHVVSQADFRVSLMFIDVYRYRHTATERWRGDCLESLNAHTDDNGDVEVVDASRRGEGLAVNATRADDWHGGCVRSFAYWNPGILEGGRLLNAQTGELVPVRVLPVGEERIEVGGRLEPTRRYRLAGDGLEIDLWYTLGEDWVALESSTPDGRRLRYERY